MKTKNVKLKLKELHNSQKVFLSDGIGIYPMTVSGKGIKSSPICTTIHSAAEGELKLAYPDSWIEFFEVGPCSSRPHYVVTHIIHDKSVIFYTFKKGTGTRVSMELTEDNFDCDVTNLRIFRKLKHAVSYCQLNSHNSELDYMDDLLLGNEHLIINLI